MNGLTEAELWLETRLRAAPPELADEVLALVREAASDGVAETLGGGAIADLLARAGLLGLDEVVATRSGRESALRLLAADAALTCAFEAAAETGGDVARLCASVGPVGALGRRLRDAGRKDGA